MGGELMIREHFEWILGSLCQLHRVPFDPALLAQQFPPPYDRAALLAAAKALDFRVGERTVGAKDLIALPLPCVAFLKQERHAAQTQPPAGTESTPAQVEEAPAPKSALIVKAGDKGILYFEAGSNTPHQLPLEQFEACFEPSVVLIAREAPQASDPDLPLSKPAFGFKWFVPELLKHKRIWRDVLAASLAIQLVALATPLFTQVVIDKVVVHHTQSTLWVIGIALVMFMLFSTVMTWMRQYLVLHTGNRVDAVLGQTVLRHLLRLPVPFHLSRGDVLVQLAVDAHRARDPRPHHRAELGRHADLPRDAQPAVPGRGEEHRLRHRIRLGHGDGEVAADGAGAGGPLRRAAGAVLGRQLRDQAVGQHL